VLTLASPHPVTFDRLGNRGVDVASPATFDVNLASQECNLDRTYYGGQKPLKETVSFTVTEARNHGGEMC